MSDLIIFIWIIDILNIGKDIYGFDLAYFLDTTLPINGLAWLLILLFVGTSKTTKVKEVEDYE